MTILLYLFVGFLGGIAGGALGIGGGTVMIPLLALFFGLSQHQAQGTVLAALLPPVFILAVWRYYIAGNVNVVPAVYVALGVFAGALIGAHIIQDIPSAQLRKIFAVFLIVMGVKLLIK